MPWCASSVTSWPSKRCAVPKVASQSRVALWTIASKTGCTSVGELLITRKTSLVAVCCSNASVRSRLRACSSLKQPHVLNRDDRLIGKCLHQLDLPFRKWFHDIAPDRETTDRRSFAQQRHGEHGSRTHLPGQIEMHSGLRLNVEDMNRFAPKKRPSGRNVRTRWKGIGAKSGDHVQRLAGVGHHLIEPTIELPDMPSGRSGESNCVGDEGIEHRLQLSWRGRNHTQNFTRRRLLLQRLGQIASCGPPVP